MRFRSKVVEIEAWPYDGSPTTRGVCCCHLMPPHLHTMHGEQTVELVLGDWIVPEPVADRFYPIKPDVFAKKYETAEAADQIEASQPCPDGKGWSSYAGRLQGENEVLRLQNGRLQAALDAALKITS